jgi:DNA-directed RNA polymerase specialized sigma24 family protein
MVHASLGSVIARLRAIAARFLRGKLGLGDRRWVVRMNNADRYRAAVAALPADTRRIFLLHRADGLDIASIAERTGRSTTVVEQHIANAILAIWTALESEQG